MKYKKSVQAIFYLMIALLFTGCTAVPLPSPLQSAAATPTPYNPFTLNMEGGDGLDISLSGYSEGYLPGGKYTFNLSASNKGDEPAEYPYCVVLVDEEKVVATFVEDTFDLPAGNGFAKNIEVNFPENLESGAYALGIVIPNRLSSTTTIHIGEDSGQPAGPFATATCP